ncbi:MAG: MEDS domain-containing protein, partial [Candidatus Rokuibacteriota bacterium]
MAETVRFEHLVHFYEADPPLLESLADFIGTGLAAGEAGIVIVTREHREGLEPSLRAAGVDGEAPLISGTYVALDAADTLSRIVVDGVPDRERFFEVIGGVVARAGRDGRPLRVFGEMVGLLLARGSTAAAIRLEDLWNELGATRAFRLLCAYPLDRLGGRGLAHSLVEVCAR